MLDQAQLRQQYRTLTVICLALGVAPFVMLAVGFFISRSDPTGLAGSGKIDVLLLGVFGSLALLPLLVVPMVRSVAAALPAQPDHPRPAGTRVMTWVIIEFAVWESSTIVGLVAFILGAPYYFLLATAVITMLGYVRSFPRWAAFVARAEAMEGSMAGMPKAG